MNVQNLSAGLPDGQSNVQRIDVRGLSKTFQLAGTAIEAVRDVSFGVRRGEFVALLGPSGSGKSTVLNMIATLIKPTGGQILIDGTPVIAGKATPNVGYIFQRDTLFPWRTAGDNIGYGLQLAGVPEAERRERAAMGGLAFSGEGKWVAQFPAHCDCAYGDDCVDCWVL